MGRIAPAHRMFMKFASAMYLRNRNMALYLYEIRYSELNDALELEDRLCNQRRSEEGSAEYECGNNHDLPAETLYIRESGSDGNTGNN